MLANLMTSTVSANRLTPTKGSTGGQKNTYSQVYANLPCSIQPISSAWKILYSQRSIETSHTLFFATPLPSLLIGDQLVTGSVTYLVQGIRDLISLGKVLVVDCEVIT
jgi:hypothetical protein